MNLLQWLNKRFAFTKNEQKVFLFLAMVLLSGVAIKVYKTYVIPPNVGEFDYAVSDSIFNERSRALNDDTLSSRSKMVRAHKVNLNTATKTELMTLPGIGEATAERIILFREEQRSFKTISDIRKVKGIGEKKFDKLKPYIEVK